MSQNIDTNVDYDSLRQNLDVANSANQKAYDELNKTVNDTLNLLKQKSYHENTQLKIYLLENFVQHDLSSVKSKIGIANFILNRNSQKDNVDLHIYINTCEKTKELMTSLSSKINEVILPKPEKETITSQECVKIQPPLNLKFECQELQIINLINSENLKIANELDNTMADMIDNNRLLDFISVKIKVERERNNFTSQFYSEYISKKLKNIHGIDKIPHAVKSHLSDLVTQHHIELDKLETAVGNWLNEPELRAELKSKLIRTAKLPTTFKMKVQINTENELISKPKIIGEQKTKCKSCNVLFNPANPIFKLCPGCYSSQKSEIQQNQKSRQRFFKRKSDKKCSKQ